MAVVVVAAAFLAAAAVLLAPAVLPGRARARRQLALIDAYGFAADATEPDVTPEQASRPSPVERLGTLVGGRMARERVDAIRRDLIGAGMYDMTPERWLGLRAASLVGIPLLLAWMAWSTKAKPNIAALEVVFGAYAGWAVPQSVLSRRARARLDAIDLAMPELVDLLVVAVESGLGFGAALQAAAERINGPLSHELTLVLREQRLGVSAQDAFRHFVERVDVPSTRAFARTLVQGERLGVSIGAMLRSLAEEMRKRRRARAEEIAQRAPVKILFPLVLLIFPAMFIVLMTPAVLNMARSFGG